MISILNIGINHETAPVEIRECLAPDSRGGDSVLLDMICKEKAIEEAFILGTCNRVEALVTSNSPIKAEEAVMKILSSGTNIDEKRLISSFYRYWNLDAVHHIFMVASSLDSMIIGEPQILGQIKKAHVNAVENRSVGTILNRLMHRAFHVAKRIRNETSVCELAVSISYAAVELAKKIFSDFNDKKVLIIGAGEMAEIAAKHLSNQGIKDVKVTNRTFERAASLAERMGWQAIIFEDIESHLINTDIVISSTGSQEYIISYADAKRAQKKRGDRPLFFIDIAVPRDIDPDINKIQNVYLYDIDDLKEVISYNKTQRKEESVKAEKIVKEEVVKFAKWLDTLAVVPTIIELRKKIKDIVDSELRRSRSEIELMDVSQKSMIEVLVNSVAEKIISDPILFLKRRAESQYINSYLDMTKRMFALDSEKEIEFHEHHVLKPNAGNEN